MSFERALVKKSHISCATEGYAPTKTHVLSAGAHLLCFFLLFPSSKIPILFIRALTSYPINCNFVILMAVTAKNKIYLFLDGIQEMEGWEHCVNACMIDFNVDI